MLVIKIDGNMATREELRKKRLKADHAEMVNLKGSIVQWKAIVGKEPYVEVYELTVNIRSIIGPGPKYRDQHVIRVELDNSYPISKPEIHMISSPHPYHPNWWPHVGFDGLWCSGDWDFAESLGHHIIRMLRVLQFDPVITNENSTTDSNQNDWYIKHKNSGLFPCDKQVLPDPTAGKIKWDAKPNPTGKLKFH